MPSIYAIAGGLLLAVAAFFYGEHVESLSCKVASQAAVIAAQDIARADQQRLDGIASAAALADAVAHPKIVTETQTVVKWAIRNVPNTANCPTPELVRVYNASIAGTDPATESAGSPAH